MKLSTEFKVIFGFLLILLFGVISSVYHIDFNSYISKFSNTISNDSEESKKIEVTLTKCIDGDTAKFEENGKVYTYRFLGINTPEVSPSAEPYGKKASEYTCNTLMNAKKIEISYEKTSVHIDKYNRHLVWVYVDSKLLQSMILEKGYAKVSYVYTKLTNLNKLYKSENKAKRDKLNLFKNYKENTYNDKTYTIIFKTNKSKSEVNVKAGNRVELINNPEGDNFEGWTLNDYLYDFSQPITSDLILEASFGKDT